MLAGYVNTSYKNQYLMSWPGMLAGYVNTHYTLNKISNWSIFKLIISDQALKSLKWILI